jgi:DNA polymerase III epsilon subunit-like protein
MNVMIDLETYSTKGNAVILTIGAIKFDNSDNINRLENMDKFYRRITTSSCLNLGMCIDPETDKWWCQQSYETRYEALINPDRIGIKEALSELIQWFGDAKYIWSQGIDFDIVILKNAFEKCNLNIPWKFWNVRDSRTIISLCGKSVQKNNSHNALNDCYNQIIALKQSLKCIKI